MPCVVYYVPASEYIMPFIYFYLKGSMYFIYIVILEDPLSHNHSGPYK